MAENLSFRKI